MCTIERNNIHGKKSLFIGTKSIIFYVSNDISDPEVTQESRYPVIKTYAQYLE